MKLVEGTCLGSELRDFILKRGLTPYVWLSEDATRITGRIQYDPKTNQLVGSVLPFNKQGMPIAFSYLAASAKAIEEHF